MVFRVIWADRLAPSGAKIDIDYEDLAIVPTNKTPKNRTNRRKPTKANPTERISHY